MPVLLKQNKTNTREFEIATTHLHWYFGFFLVSGFCGLVYEVVWVRLAMASFGVTTALVSIVISMFMAGLGLGSWGAGVLARRILIHEWGASSTPLFHCGIIGRSLLTFGSPRS